MPTLGYDIFVKIRINKEIQSMLEELNKEYPNDYNSLSHIVRSAIIIMHREKVLKAKERRYNPKIITKRKLK